MDISSIYGRVRDNIRGRSRPPAGKSPHQQEASRPSAQRHQFGPQVGKTAQPIRYPHFRAHELPIGDREQAIRAAAGQPLRSVAPEACKTPTRSADLRLVRRERLRLRRALARPHSAWSGHRLQGPASYLARGRSWRGPLPECGSCSPRADTGQRRQVHGQGARPCLGTPVRHPVRPAGRGVREALWLQSLPRAVRPTSLAGSRTGPAPAASRKLASGRAASVRSPTPPMTNPPWGEALRLGAPRPPRGSIRRRR